MPSAEKITIVGVDANWYHLRGLELCLESYGYDFIKLAVYAEDFDICPLVYEISTRKILPDLVIARSQLSDRSEGALTGVWLANELGKLGIPSIIMSLFPGDRDFIERAGATYLDLNVDEAILHAAIEEIVNPHKKP